VTGSSTAPDQPITIRTATEEDWDAVLAVASAAFHDDPDAEVAAAERISFDPTRTLVAERDGQVVGTAAILTRQMCVPGSLVPTAHITLVSVAPTARRQGILTRFIRRQFDDARAAGEPVAALWASEARIYQRYGFGLAARRVSFVADSREIEIIDPGPGPEPGPGGDRGPDRSWLREGRPAEFRDTMRVIYDQVYPHRPGWSERSTRAWDLRLADPAAWRQGSTPLRIVVNDTAAGPDGYALWRVSRGWSDAGPNAEVRVVELVATNPRAYLSLWRFLLRLDLTRSVEVWTAAIDEPLFLLVTEPRRLQARMSDSLWVRILDLPAALTSRRYAAPVDLVFEVTDDLIGSNAGRWRLVGTPGSVSCTSTVEPADLSCDIRVLGSAYLGDQRFAALAAAGMIHEHRPGALAAASTAFGWHRAPSGLEVF
jgi:predicted acetyltransferase